MLRQRKLLLRATKREILQSVADETIKYEEGSIFLDCSTVDVASAKLVAENAKIIKSFL